MDGGCLKRNIFLIFLHPPRLRTFSAYVPPFRGDQGTRSSSFKNLKHKCVGLFYEIKHHHHCPYGKHTYYPQS